MATDFTKTGPRHLWMKREIPALIRKAGRALTLPQITASLGSITNPSYYSARHIKRQPWEFHLEYEEVTLILKMLMAELIIEKDKNRRRYDPKKGRIRYDLMNPIVALANVAADNSGDKPTP